MKNYLGQTLGLTILVTAFLLMVAAFSTEATVAGVTLRKMDILSDVRGIDPLAGQAAALDSLAALPTDTTALAADSLNTDTVAVAGPWPAVDESLFGNTLEDYTPQQDGLTRFFSAVDSIQSHRRTVRVAFFGDSFVEGDILLGDFRDSLQTVWGGAGVGFVPMDSEIARFRRTFLQQHIKGWRTFSIVNNEGNSVPLGINGHVYLPSPEAAVRFDGTTQYGFAHTRNWGEVRLFYRASEGLNFVWQNEGQGPVDAFLPATPQLVGAWKHSAAYNSIPAFAFRFPQTSGLTVYGASLENGPGFYVDNFSTRGNSGGKLRLIRPDVVQAFDRFQHYDLVVLQYGLNAAGNTTRNLNWYRAELEQTYTHIRQCFPNTPVLIVSVPDRAGKIDGQLTTLPSVPAIAQMQRDLARKHGFLFLDFFHFLGGPGTMVRLAAASHPMLANRDYTHLTHEGGRLEGRRLAALFLSEQARWRARQAQ